MTTVGSRTAFWVLLGVVATLAAATHLVNPAGFPAFSGEEASLIGRAQTHMEKGEWYSPGFEFQAPFGAAWLLELVFGFSEDAWSSGRVLVAVLAVGDAVLLYLIGTRLRSAPAGAAAALAFTLSAWGFGEFRRVILPSFGVFFTLLALALLVHRVPLRPLLSGAAYGTALFMDAAALAAFPVVGLLVAREYRGRPIALATFSLAALLLALLWPLQASFSGAGFAAWREGVAQAYDGPSLLPLQALLTTSPLLVLLGLAAAAYLGVRDRDLVTPTYAWGGLLVLVLLGPLQKSAALALVPALCVALGVAAASLAVLATERVRAWVESAEGATPLGASGAATVQSVVVAVLLAVPIAVPGAESTDVLPSYWEDKNADLMAATAFITERAAPGDVVVAAGIAKVGLRAHDLKVYDWYRDDLDTKGVRFLLVDKNARWDVKSGCAGNCPDLKPLYDQSVLAGGPWGEYEVREVAQNAR